MMRLHVRSWVIVSIVLTGIAVSNSAVAAPPPQFHWVDNAKEKYADLLFGDQPVVRYVYDFDTSTPERRKETFKVFHHVFSPADGHLITNGTDPKSLWPHHRGIFVGWDHTKLADADLDFWHGKNGAHQRHDRFVSMSGNAQSGSMTSQILWEDGDGKLVIREVRSVTVSKVSNDGGPVNGWQIDWRTALTSNRGNITLGGERQHGGVQFRAAQPVADSKSVTYIRPSGFSDVSQPIIVKDPPNAKMLDEHMNLGWLAMTYLLNGTRYTIEYFEDPKVPRPSRYSESDYGRFGAFVTTTLTPGKPLRLRYRIRVTSGDAPTQAAIQSHYDEFVATLKP